MKALAQGKRRRGCFINRHNYPKAIIMSINKEGYYSQNKRLGRGAKPRRDQTRAVAILDAGHHWPTQAMEITYVLCASRSEEQPKSPTGIEHTTVSARLPSPVGSYDRQNSVRAKVQAFLYKQFVCLGSWADERKPGCQRGAPCVTRAVVESYSASAMRVAESSGIRSRSRNALFPVFCAGGLNTRIERFWPSGTMVSRGPSGSKRDDTGSVTAPYEISHTLKTRSHELCDAFNSATHQIE